MSSPDELRQAVQDYTDHVLLRRVAREFGRVSEEAKSYRNSWGRGRRFFFKHEYNTETLKVMLYVGWAKKAHQSAPPGTHYMSLLLKD